MKVLPSFGCIWFNSFTNNAVRFNEWVKIPIFDVIWIGSWSRLLIRSYGNGTRYTSVVFHHMGNPITTMIKANANDAKIRWLSKCKINRKYINQWIHLWIYFWKNLKRWKTDEKRYFVCTFDWLLFFFISFFFSLFLLNKRKKNILISNSVP